MKYELQYQSNGLWIKSDGSSSLEFLRRARKRYQRDNPEAVYRVVMVVEDEPERPAPTIEERHVEELGKLEADEKRWSAKAKLAATKLKKIRRRKRRLERLYAPKDEPA